MWLLPLLIALGAPFGADGVEKIVVVDVPPDGPLATSVYSRDADWVLIPIVGRCMRIHVYPSGIRVEPVEPEPREEATMALPDTGYALLEVSNPSSALTDFSLMVDLSLLPQDWWDAVDTTDPTKGRAAKNAGKVELPCDWIAFDADTQTGWLRVLWTGTLASTGEQLLRVYPPVSANASVAADDTYGQYAAYDEDWAAYWPLDGDTKDRTANGKDLTAFGSPIGGQSGKIAQAYSLNGSNQYLEIDDPVVGTGYPYTLAVWFRSSTDSANQTLISLVDKDSTGDYQYLWAFGRGDGDPIRYASRVGIGATRSADTTDGYSANNWHWAVAVGASSTDRRVYLDAGGEGQSTNSSEPPNRDRLSVGRMGDASPGDYFTGLIDEVQAHTVARSAAWIAHEYAQTSDPATFWGEAEWVPGDSGGVVYNETVTATAVTGVFTSDTVLFEESLSVGAVAGATATPAVVLSESCTATLAAGCSVSSALTLVESLLASAGCTAQVAESVEWQETVTAALQAAAGAAATGSFDAAVTVTVSAGASVGEAVELVPKVTFKATARPRLFRSERATRFEVTR